MNKTNLKKYGKYAAHISAGILTLILLAVSITQCSGKKSAVADKEKAVADKEKADKCVQELIEVTKGKDCSYNRERERNAALSDSVAVLNDSIRKLNAELADCRNKQKPVKRASRKARPAWPVVAQPTRICPDTVTTGSDVKISRGYAEKIFEQSCRCR